MNQFTFRQHRGRPGLDRRQRRGHRVAAVKVLEQPRRARPSNCRAPRTSDVGVQKFGSAVRIVAGIETMHMIKKGQLACRAGKALPAADQFYSLAL